MTEQENLFYSQNFKFSYSSMNKLLFSPSLFYKEYILKNREEKIDKHLIEGKLIHCLFFEPENLKNKFKIVPGKTPTDNVKKIIHKLADRVLMNGKVNVDLMSDELKESILEILKEENLYQTLKEDSARLTKIQCEENQEYWNFINDSKVDIIDQDTLNKCQYRVDILKQNKDISELLTDKPSDFVLDPLKVYVEQYLECKLVNKKFGLKGFVDFYKIDENQKTVTICDLKTTSKSITDFSETIDYYNYWLQAAIYTKLVYENLGEDKDDYTFIFKFAVIDSFDQVYLFEVSQPTLTSWALNLDEALKIVDYHYSNNNYTLPYEFLTGKVYL